MAVNGKTGWTAPPVKGAPTKPQRSKEEMFKDIHELARKAGVKVGVYGVPESGKTHFCCSAPPPVYILETNDGAAQLANNFPGKDIKVFNCYVTTGDPQTECKASLDVLREALNALSDLEEGTICIDDGTDLWEWIGGVLRLEVLKVDLAARVQPSDYKWANAEYRSIIMKCRAINANFIMTAMAEEVFKDAKLTPTGVMRAGWQKWTPKYLDCIIRLIKEETKAGYTYRAFIEKFRQHRLVNRDFVNFDFDALYKEIQQYLVVPKVVS